jgi:uncharacterized protein
MRPWQLMAVASLCAGCASSPPVHFYTLDPMDSAHPSTVARVVLQVGAVHVPPELDRKTMVSQNAPNTLTVAEQDRWGAPLDQMVRRVLTQDLIRRLPQGEVIAPESTAPAGTKVIALNILRFQREPTGTVVLDGSWSASVAGSDDPGVEHTLALQAPGVQNNSAAQARAMSQLVADLADAIVTGSSSR